MPKMKLVLATVVLLSSYAAQATPIVWAINEARLSDGGTVSGEFTYDADTSVFSDWSISFSGGFLPSLNYNTSNSATDSEMALANNPSKFTFILGDGSRYGILGWMGALTNAGGSHLIKTNDASANGAYECNNCGTYRTYRSASVVSQAVTAPVSVPEPATLALLGIGLVSIVVLRRKQRT